MGCWWLRGNSNLKLFKKLREYWSNFYENTDALVFVIDSSDQMRLEEGGKELDKLLSE